MIERINTHGYRFVCDHCKATLAEDGDFAAALAIAVRKGWRGVIHEHKEETLCGACFEKLAGETPAVPGQEVAR